MASKIAIQFEVGLVPAIGTQISFKNDKTGVTHTEVCVSSRTAINQFVYQPDPISAYQSYQWSFNLDHNTLNEYSWSWENRGLDDDALILTANDPTVTFSNLVNTTTGLVTIENAPVATPIQITNVTSTLYATDNSKVRVNVTTNIQATDILSPVTQAVTTNPHTFIFSKGQTFTITMKDANLNTSSQQYRTPDWLVVSPLEIVLVNTPSGGNVTVNMSQVYGLNLEYSIDGIIWQTSNVFQNLLQETSYVVRVRDQFGIEVTRLVQIPAFSVEDSINPLTPLFIVPIPNSIRYAKRNGAKKNINTALSNEEEVRLPFCATQMFKTTDVIKTQFKSSYPNHTAYVTNGTTQYPLAITKKTNYIGAKDMRDAKIRNRPDGFLGVSFISGNTYNYDTLAVTGTYDLNGGLPAWAVIDRYFNLQDIGWVVIEDIVRDETDSFWELKIRYQYLGAPTYKRVGTIYNAQNYEVYEFNVAMSSYKGIPIQVAITGTNNDEGWVAQEYLSEIINVQDSFENTVEIEYWNDTNTSNVFYQTGIKHKMIHDGLVTNYKGEGKQEVHLGDTRAVLVDSDLSNTFDVIIFEVTTAIARQISYAFSHKFILINELYYIAKEKAEVEKIGEHTNLYNVRVKLVEAGNLFSEDIENIPTNGDLIGLLTAENNYIKI